MTYPPSGSFGQQPDPYGQQQPGQYGQPQQPDPYGQQQQYGGFPQVSYGGLGSGGGEPPKSNKNAILATVVVVVVLLAGVGVTGFVAPGFFLSDDKDTTGGGGDGGETLEAFADKLVKAADGQDKDALEKLVCSGAQDRLTTYVNTIDQTEGAKKTSVKETGGGKGEIKIDITVDGDDNSFTINAAKDGDKWCWDAVNGDYEGTEDPTTSEEETTTEDTSTEDTSATNGPDQGGEAFLNQFLSTLSTGDVAATQALLCSDSSDGDDVAAAAPQLPQLQIDPNALTVEDGHVTADLVGTMNGAPATGFLTAFLEDAGWCAYVFSAYPG
jgi:hypothetical protein